MIDVQAKMTFHELKNFFSMTQEFQVIEAHTERHSRYEIRLVDEGSKYKNVCSTLISEVTIQQLIRTIHQLSYNMATKNYD